MGGSAWTRSTPGGCCYLRSFRYLCNIMRLRMPVIVLSLVLAGAGRAAAQEPDSLSVVQLDSTVFSAERHESVLHIGVT